jgi:hypothetical protein
VFGGSYRRRGTVLRPEELGDVLGVAAKVGVSVEYVETNSS